MTENMLVGMTTLRMLDNGIAWNFTQVKRIA